MLFFYYVTTVNMTLNLTDSIMRSSLVLLTILIACASHTFAATPVKVMQAKQQDYSKPIHLSGVIEHKTSQQLAFKVPGFVDQISVQQGQSVEKGQLLASLDLEEINAEYQQAQANTVLAKNEWQRAKSLFDKNMLSQAQLDQSLAQYDVAKAVETKARFNLRHAQIKAPSNGIILKRLIEKNELLAAGSPAFVLADQNDGWIIKAAVSDKDFIRLRLHDPAELALTALPGQTLKAHISELPAMADQFQTYTIELKVDAEDSTSLHQGLVSYITITPQQTQKLILLPSSAMVRAKRTATERANAQYSQIDIFVVNAQQQAELRSVNLQAIVGDKLLISDGLNDGETVVISGANYLSHLQDVEIQE